MRQLILGSLALFGAVSLACDALDYALSRMFPRWPQ